MWHLIIAFLNIDLPSSSVILVKYAITRLSIKIIHMIREYDFSSLS